MWRRATIQALQQGHVCSRHVSRCDLGESAAVGLARGRIHTQRRCGAEGGAQPCGADHSELLRADPLAGPEHGFPPTCCRVVHARSGVGADRKGGKEEDDRVVCVAPFLVDDVHLRQRATQLERERPVYPSHFASLAGGKDGRLLDFRGEAAHNGCGGQCSSCAPQRCCFSQRARSTPSP